MDKFKIKNFLDDENNREALKLLVFRMREIDTIREGEYSRYTEESRRMALEIVEKWLFDLLGTTKENFQAFKEEDEYEGILKEIK